MQLSEAEYADAQRLASTESPVSHFFVYHWPGIACGLAVLTFLVAVTRRLIVKSGFRAGVVIADGLAGSAFWGATTPLDIGFRASFGASNHFEARCSSLLMPRGSRSITKFLENNSVAVFVLMSPRFAILSLAELDTGRRGRLAEFAREQILLSRMQ